MKQPICQILWCLCVLGCSSSSDGTGGDDNSTAGGGAGDETAGASGAAVGGGGTANGGGTGGFSGSTVSNGGHNSGGGGSGGVDAGGSAGAAGSGLGGSSGGPPMSPEEALYTANCLLCHGAKGAGSLLAPEIQHPVPDFTVWMVRNGSEARGVTAFPGPMAPLDESVLTADQLDSIISYLNAFPKPTTGEGLFLDYCSNCHGKDAKGGVSTHDLTKLNNPATDVPMKVRAGNHPGDFANRTEYMPKRDASVLTDDDLSMIAQYLDSL